MLAAREIVDLHGGNVQLLARIEKFDTIENIDDILDASDGIMVARGDLGIEIPYYDVPMTQKLLIKRANNMEQAGDRSHADAALHDDQRDRFARGDQ